MNWPGSSSRTKWWGKAANQEGGLDGGLDPGGETAGDELTEESGSSWGLAGPAPSAAPTSAGLKATNSQLADLSEPLEDLFFSPRAYFLRRIFVLKLDMRKLLSGTVNHIATGSVPSEGPECTEKKTQDTDRTTDNETRHLTERKHTGER